MTLRQQVQEFIEGQKELLSPTTIKAYADRLERFIAFADDRKVTPVLMTKYIPSLLADGLARRSALAYYGTVQTLYVWLVEAGLSIGNPVPKLKRFVVPASDRQPVLSHEYDNLMSTAREEGRADWLYAIRCGWETGLRLGDVATLRWPEVDLVALCIKRTPIKTSRFGKVVEIPITEGLLRMMRDCPPYAEGDPSFICPRMAQQHKWDQHKTLSSQFSRLAAKAGVKKSFHCLRHGFVARMLNKGVPAAVVQSFTGHSLRQLQGYSHVDMETKRNALA